MIKMIDFQISCQCKTVTKSFQIDDDGFYQIPQFYCHKCNCQCDISRTMKPEEMEQPEEPEVQNEPVAEPEPVVEAKGKNKAKRKVK